MKKTFLYQIKGEETELIDAMQRSRKHKKPCWNLHGLQRRRSKVINWGRVFRAVPISTVSDEPR